MKYEQLGCILRRCRVAVDIQDDQIYRQVRVRLHHRGAVLRDEVLGSTIGSARYVVKSGQIVISRIDARNGAVAIVPPELDGAVVSNDFWVFDVRDDIELGYIDHFFETLQFRDGCERASTGTTNRRRLQEAKFFDIQVPVPTTEAGQRAVVTRVDGQVKLAQEATDLAAQARTHLSDAYPAAVRHIFTTTDVSDCEADIDRLLTDLRAADADTDRANNATPGVSESIVGPFPLAPGWRWVALGSLCTHIVDCVNDTPEFVERATGFLGLKTTNIRTNELRLDESWHVTEADYETWNRRLQPRAGDLVLTREAPMGFVAQIPVGLKACLTQRLVLLRTDPDAVNPNFLTHALNDWLLLDQANALSKSSPPHLRVRDIAKLAVPVCGRSAQLEAAETLDSVFRSLATADRALRQRQRDLAALSRGIFSTAFASA